MAIVVTRKHWIPLGLIAAIYFLAFNRVMGHSAVHPTFFPWVGVLGAIGCAFFAPTVVVKRKHWIVFAVLLAMQIFGVLATVTHAGTHIAAFLWVFILVSVTSYSFAAALLIVQIVGVVAPKRQ